MGKTMMMMMMIVMMMLLLVLCYSLFFLVTHDLRVHCMSYKKSQGNNTVAFLPTAAGVKTVL